MVARASSGQTELNLAAPPDPAAVASPEDVERVVTILRSHGQLTAVEICREMGLAITENNKRKVRAVARAAFPGIISFVGSEGYKLLEQCSLDEAWAADAALACQQKDISAKRLLLRKAINDGKVGLP